MNCEDMMKIPKLKGVLKLKAGDKGLNHPIRWIYFADCLQCVKSEYRIKDYIHGGEFVILTNRSVTDDNEKLMNLISKMQEHDIAALGINEGQISDELMQYCENKNLPLFELPEKFPLIDLSQILCQELVREESNKNSVEQLFSSILNSEHINKENILTQAKSLNVDLNGKLSVIEFAFQKNDSNVATENPDQSEDNLLTLGQKIRRIINMVFSFSENMLILTQMESILMLFPVEKISEEELKKLLLQVVDRVNSECNVKVDIGIGNSSDYLEDIKQSRKEASAAIRIARHSESKEHFSFYRDLGVYTLISQISDVRLLDKFVDDHIGKLIHADELNERSLCETLEKYIDHNCNAKETAAAMYIHRNTLNYRLNKIREIMGDDFDDMNNCLMIKLAFMIRGYREWRKN